MVGDIIKTGAIAKHQNLIGDASHYVNYTDGGGGFADHADPICQVIGAHVESLVKISTAFLGPFFVEIPTCLSIDFKHLPRWAVKPIHEAAKVFAWPITEANKIKNSILKLTHAISIKGIDFGLTVNLGAFIPDIPIPIIGSLIQSMLSAIKFPLTSLPLPSGDLNPLCNWFGKNASELQEAFAGTFKSLTATLMMPINLLTSLIAPLVEIFNFCKKVLNPAKAIKLIRKFVSFVQKLIAFVQKILQALSSLPTSLIDVLLDAVMNLLRPIFESIMAGFSSPNLVDRDPYRGMTLDTVIAKARQLLTTLLGCFGSPSDEVKTQLLALAGELGAIGGMMLEIGCVLAALLEFIQLKFLFWFFAAMKGKDAINPGEGDPPIPNPQSIEEARILAGPLMDEAVAKLAELSAITLPVYFDPVGTWVPANPDLPTYEMWWYWLSDNNEYQWTYSIDHYPPNFTNVSDDRFWIYRVWYPVEKIEMDRTPQTYGDAQRPPGDNRPIDADGVFRYRKYYIAEIEHSELWDEDQWTAWNEHFGGLTHHGEYTEQTYYEVLPLEYRIAFPPHINETGIFIYDHTYVWVAKRLPDNTLIFDVEGCEDFQGNYTRQGNNFGLMVESSIYGDIYSTEHLVSWPPIGFPHGRLRAGFQIGATLAANYTHEGYQPPSDPHIHIDDPDEMWIYFDSDDDIWNNAWHWGQGIENRREFVRLLIPSEEGQYEEGPPIGPPPLPQPPPPPPEYFGTITGTITGEDPEGGDDIPLEDATVEATEVVGPNEVPRCYMVNTREDGTYSLSVLARTNFKISSKRTSEDGTWEYLQHWYDDKDGYNQADTVRVAINQVLPDINIRNAYTPEGPPPPLAYGTISGHVEVELFGAIAGVHVTAIRIGTGYFAEDAFTNEQGNYTIYNLLLNESYHVEATYTNSQHPNQWPTMWYNNTQHLNQATPVEVSTNPPDVPNVLGIDFNITQQ